MRMIHAFAGFGLVLLLGLSFLGIAEQEDAQGYQIVHNELPEAVHEAVETHFLNPRTPSAEMIATSGNIEIVAPTTVSMTFVFENAGFQNSVGYFTYDEDGSILEQRTVFENFSGTGPGLLGGGELEPGDTITIGSFSPGERVGFFLIANGFTNPNGHHWYTLPQHNADRQDHDAVMILEEIGTLIGFEDLWNLGDEDYSDAIMLITTLIEQLEEEVTADQGSDSAGGSDQGEEPAGGSDQDSSSDQGEEPEGGSDQDSSSDQGEEPADDSSSSQRPAAPPRSEFDVAVEQLQSLFGVTEEQAGGLISQNGLFPVQRALRFASDPSSFWGSLLGYDVQAVAGGGGGSSDDDDSLYVLEFQMRHPLTGEVVESARASLTVAEHVSTPNGIQYNLIEVVQIPFNRETQSHRYDLRDLSLAPGNYEFCVGFSDGTHMLFGLIIPTAD